jgi:hypothetical protein
MTRSLFKSGATSSTGLDQQKGLAGKSMGRASQLPIGVTNSTALLPGNMHRASSRAANLTSLSCFSRSFCLYQISAQDL